MTGLVGADGAGKTTLIRIAAGLFLPTAGSVTVLGMDSVADSIDIQSQVGYMPQKFGLYQDLTVEENMTLYADLQGVPMAERQERYRRLLQMTSLSRYTKRRAGALSGGMKQKLGLACSLIKSPRMLLLDEPTVGVDPVSRRELWKIVYALVEDEGIGVLLSTAYLDEAERCQHVVVLHHGAKLAEGSPGDFRRQVEGRTFLVEPPEGVKPREIQMLIAGGERIVDATIHSGRVRVVTTGFEKSAVDGLLPEKWQAKVRNAAPTFEDAFMSMIPQAQCLDAPRAASPSGETRRTGEVVVKTKDLRKRFGDFEAVKGISFEVRRAEIFGLLGPNGAGKSTTFRMLCGFCPSPPARSAWPGATLGAPAPGPVPSGIHGPAVFLYGQLSVEENLRFYGRATGSPGSGWENASNGPTRNSGLAAGVTRRRLSFRRVQAAFGHGRGPFARAGDNLSGRAHLRVDPLARREFWLRINGFASKG